MKSAIESVALAFVFAVVAFLPPAAGSAPHFSEGMWEMKGDVKFQGAMHVEGRTIPLKPTHLHYSKCLTKQDMVPQKQEKNDKCTTNVKVSGNTVTWVMKCTEPNRTLIDSSGMAVFSRTSFDAKGKSVMTDPQGRKVRAALTLKGHWTGPCR